MTIALLPIAASTAELRSACGEDPGWFCRQALNVTGSEEAANTADALLGKPLTILAVVLGASVVSRLVRRSIKRTLRRLHSGGLTDKFASVRERAPSALLATTEVSLRAEQRMEALATVLRSVASFVIWTFATFLVLDEVGLQIGPLLAGAGIVGVALGFGSQSLVKDFLSGIFILIEDQFGVGDIVDLGDASGTVEAVSLRTTRLRAVDGTVWHVPNGEIRRVGNMSQHWSRAVLDLRCDYGSDLARAQELVKREADAVWHEDSNVLEEPEVWGVEDLGLHGVVIRLVIKTRPSKQWTVSRRLRERIMLAWEAEGIGVPALAAVSTNGSGGDDD